MPVLEARPRVRCKTCQDTGMMAVQGLATLNPGNTREPMGQDDKRTGFEPGFLRHLSPSRFVVMEMPCIDCPPLAPRRRDWERP